MNNVEKIIDGMLVVWNRKKAAINKQKHGVAFEDAALVFADENAIVFHDDEHSQDEDRRQIIGLVEDVLLVVFTERGEAIRLITARAATPNERREYYGRELHGMQDCLQGTEADPRTD